MKKKYKWDDDYLNLVINEYAKMLQLCVLYTGQIVPGKNIDKVWHDHILHTKDYMSFCEKELGTFIHHVPNNSDEDEERENNTYLLYEKTFGYKPSDLFWSNIKYKGHHFLIIKSQKYGMIVVVAIVEALHFNTLYLHIKLCNICYIILK